MEERQRELNTVLEILTDIDQAKEAIYEGYYEDKDLKELKELTEWFKKRVEKTLMTAIDVTMSEGYHGT